MPTAGGATPQDSLTHQHAQGVPADWMRRTRQEWHIHTFPRHPIYFLQTYNKYICTAGVAFDVLCENEESISGKFATNIK
jgi:hypothetical protein